GAGGFVLLTPIDPNTFRATYRLPVGAIVLQFTAGTLDNAGETIELSKPSGGNAVVADSLTYDNAAPWPASPNGTGPTLAKKSASLFGDDPISWQASNLTAGTPGQDNSTINSKPTVDAGGDQSVTFPANVNLVGNASDDALPATGIFTTSWSKFAGPGTV